MNFNLNELSVRHQIQFPFFCLIPFPVLSPGFPIKCSMHFHSSSSKLFSDMTDNSNHHFKHSMPITISFSSSASGSSIPQQEKKPCPTDVMIFPQTGQT